MVSIKHKILLKIKTESFEYGLSRLCSESTIRDCNIKNFFFSVITGSEVDENFWHKDLKFDIFVTGRVACGYVINYRATFTCTKKKIKKLHNLFSPKVAFMKKCHERDSSFWALLSLCIKLCFCCLIFVWNCTTGEVVQFMYNCYRLNTIKISLSIFDPSPGKPSNKLHFIFHIFVNSLRFFF